MFRRKGMTLVELMLVLGIIALLIAVSLAAVVSAREAATRIQSMNNLRQLALAVQQFAGTDAGRLPGLGGGLGANDQGVPILGSLCPYLEEVPVTETSQNTNSFAPVKTFLSPADPTVPDALAGKDPNISSYAANARAFSGSPRLPSTFSDGLSNTLAFAEHYAFKYGGSYFDPFFAQLGMGTGFRRATFADTMDLVPVTQGNPPVSRSSYPGLTFQVAPARSACDPAEA